MKKVIRLTEGDLVKLVNRVLSEQSNQDLTRPTHMPATKSPGTTKK